MDRGAWGAIVAGVTKSWTWLTNTHFWTSLVAQMVKNLPAVWETWVQSLGWEDPLEKRMTTHSNIFAWRIPWPEEPGGLQSTVSQRVGRDWATEQQQQSHPWVASVVPCWRPTHLPRSHSNITSSMKALLMSSIQNWLSPPLQINCITVVIFLSCACYLDLLCLFKGVSPLLHYRLIESKVSSSLFV